MVVNQEFPGCDIGNNNPCVPPLRLSSIITTKDPETIPQCLDLIPFLWFPALHVSDSGRESREDEYLYN